MITRIALALTALALTACPEAGPKDDSGAMDGLWACDETATTLDLDEVSALGFSGQSLAELIEGARLATFTYADGTTTPVTLTASSPGEVRYIEATEPTTRDTGMYTADAIWDSGSGDACPDRLEVDMTVTFATVDGAFDETWAVVMSSQDGATATFYATLDPSGFNGTYDMAEHVSATDYDELSAWVSGSMDSTSTSGELSGMASGSEDCDDGEDCVAWAENVGIGAWGGDLATSECAGDLVEADAGSYEILLAGDVYAETLSEATVLVISDEASWANLVARFESGAESLSTASVDFVTQQIVAVFYYKSSTCGLSIESYGVQKNTDVDSLNLSAEIYDSSGGCDTACDAIGQVAVIAAVARGADDATGCRTSSGACD